MKISRLLSVPAIAAVLLFHSCQSSTASFVKVENCRFACEDYPSHYTGTNFFSGPVLASEGESGDLERLEKELDDIKGLGMKNIRLFVDCTFNDGISSDEEVYLKGLDCLLAEMAERGLKAVLCIQEAEGIVTRINTVTGKLYKEDPTIFSWQIGSCLYGEGGTESVSQVSADSLRKMAVQIKSLDRNHMLSAVGTGDIQYCTDIDYVTIQIWPYAWGWIDENTPKSNLKTAIAKTDEYIDAQIEAARRCGKPLVIDAFAYPRDDFKSAQDSPVNDRNNYFKHVFERLVESAKTGDILAGVNYWTWGGQTDLSGLDPAKMQMNYVYISDGWTNLITSVYSQHLEQALRPQFNIDIHQENGIFSQPGLNTIGLTLRHTEKLKADLEFTVETDFGDTIKTVERKIRLSADKPRPLSLDVDMTPGFYRIRAAMTEKDGVRTELADLIVGCDPENISSPKNNQPDLDQFWEETLAELAEVKPEYRLTLLEDQSNEVRRTWRVDMKSFGGEQICGIYVEPVAEGKFPAMIHYMGYDTKVWDIDPSAEPEMSEFILCVRGQALNKKGSEAGWVKQGIESQYSYYYRGAICDAIRAIDFVSSRTKTDPQRIFAQGESQGGAFTLAAASLDRRIRAAAPSSPFLCDLSDFLKLARWPSNEILEAAAEKGMNDEDINRVLSYFDMKNLAHRIECPIIMGVGLQDNICPIHTNFAGYNAVRSEKSWICYPLATHNVCEQPGWPEAKKTFFSKFM